MPNYSFCLECIKGGICSTDSENDSVSGYFRPQVSLVSLSRHSALEAKKKKMLARNQPGSIQVSLIRIHTHSQQLHFGCAK